MKIRKYPLALTLSAFLAGALATDGAWSGEGGPEEEEPALAGPATTLTRSGQWESDGETLTLTALPGERYVVIATVRDAAEDDAPTRREVQWLTEQTGAVEVTLPQLSNLIVARVTSAFVWSGEVWVGCDEGNCPFPPPPEPLPPFPPPPESAPPLTSGGSWQTDGVSLKLEAGAGERFLVVHGIRPAAGGDPVGGPEAAWLTAEAGALKLALAETTGPVVAAVAEGSRWTGAGFSSCEASEWEDCKP